MALAQNVAAWMFVQQPTSHPSVSCRSLILCRKSAKIGLLYLKLEYCRRTSSFSSSSSYLHWPAHLLLLLLTIKVYLRPSLTPYRVVVVVGNGQYFIFPNTICCTANPIQKAHSTPFLDRLYILSVGDLDTKTIRLPAFRYMTKTKKDRIGSNYVCIYYTISLWSSEVNLISCCFAATATYTFGR